MDLFGLIGIAVLTAVLAVTVKQFRPELAMQVSIAGGAVISISVLIKVSGLIDAVRELNAQSGIGEDWLGLIVKIAGIAYVSQIASELCRDSGEGALAVKAELCGRVMMLASAMPAIAALIRMLSGLIDEIG